MLIIHVIKERIFSIYHYYISIDDSSGSEAIGPAEVAILQSMVTGGHILSFKAHFLSELPSLLPLSNTLTHLNVSFNCLQVTYCNNVHK